MYQRYLDQRIAKNDHQKDGLSTQNKVSFIEQMIVGVLGDRSPNLADVEVIPAYYALELVLFSIG